MMPGQSERQLILELPHAVGQAVEDFLPARCNRAALEAVLAWPRWPAVALVLDGPAGSGKTHLARIMAERAKVPYLAAAMLRTEPEAAADRDPLQRLGRARALVVDDADELADERYLLHLYNLLAERGGHLLLTSGRQRAAWQPALPDLRSRLGTAWRVTIEPPDEALLASLLVKQLNDRQLRVEPEVIGYLVSRMERSFAAVRRIVTALDHGSLATGRPIGLALAREVLKDNVIEDEATPG